MMLLLMPMNALAEDKWQDWRAYWNEAGLPGAMDDMMEEIIRGEIPDISDKLGQWLHEDGKALLQSNIKKLAVLLVLAVITAVIQAILEGKHPEVQWIMSLLAAGKTLSFCLPLIQNAEAAMERLCNFVSAAAPGISVVLLAAGREASSQMLSPLGTAFVTLWSSYAKPVLMGAVVAGMILSLMDGLSPQHPFRGIHGLLRTASYWILGVSLTVMGGILGIKTAISIGYDGIWMRSARYAVDHAVSGIGSALSEMLGTAAASARLTAMGMGISAILILLSMVLRPGLELLLLSLAMDMGAAWGDMWGHNMIGEMWRAAAGWLRILLYAMLAAAILAMAMVGWICLAGNG